MAGGADYVLAVRSITSAMRAQKILERQGFHASIQRSTTTSPQGCGYTVRITGDLSAALSILQAAEIEILEVRR